MAYLSILNIYIDKHIFLNIFILKPHSLKCIKDEKTQNITCHFPGVGESRHLFQMFQVVGGAGWGLGMHGSRRRQFKCTGSALFIFI